MSSQNSKVAAALERVAELGRGSDPSQTPRNCPASGMHHYAAPGMHHYAAPAMKAPPAPLVSPVK